MSIESKTWPSSDKAKQFVKDTICIDFFASPFGAGWTEDIELHDYISRAIATGITGASMTIAETDNTWEKFLNSHRRWRNTFLQYADRYVFVHNVRDIEYAQETGKYAVIFNSQTSTIVSGDLSRIATLRAMGLASMQLVYNGRFRAGVGCIDALHYPDTGLTDWGRKIIDEMVKQGIVVDLSHASWQTTEDAIAHMNQKHPGVPVVYTHSLPAGLYKNTPNATEKGCYRNITDEQAQKAATTGGFISPTFTEWMMDGIWPDDITPLQCAQMIDYYAKLLGEDHVGIASDDLMKLDLVVKFAKAAPDIYNDNNYMFDAFDKGAEGCGEMAKILPAVTDELWKMGYSDEAIKKFYGGNEMRVYRQVWK